MAVRSKVGLVKDGFMPGTPKKTRQGDGKHTKLSATSRNGARKRYRGQGKQIVRLVKFFYGLFDC